LELWFRFSGEQRLFPVSCRLRLRGGFPGGNAGARKEAAGGEEFGVEQGRSCGSAQQVVRGQCEVGVEERAVADQADGGGHTVASVDVTTWLRAVFFVEDDYGILKSSWEGGKFFAHREVAKDFAYFGERGYLFEAHRNGFEVAVFDGDAVAVGTDAE